MEPNSESTWIFDVATKKQHISKIFTVMTGSVVTSGSSKKKTDTKKRGGDGKENTNTSNKRARGAKAAAKPKACALPTIPAEKDVETNIVTCSIGVRNKLWVDDLLRCINHVTGNITLLFGCGDPETVSELKLHLLETGLLFCFKDQIMLETNRGPKLFKKWSMMRPALGEHAMQFLVKVWCQNLQSSVQVQTC